MEKVVCPKCHSDQIHAGQKGFNSASALAGAFSSNVTTGIGMGMIGSNKTVITCLKCGNRFAPGEGTIMILDNDSGAASYIKQIPNNNRKNTWRMVALVLLVIVITILAMGYNRLTSLAN